MKRIFSILFLFTVIFTSSYAQPSAKKMSKSVFTLTTYSDDGSIKSSSTQGVFITDDGEAISLWTPFVDAHRATVTTGTGEVMDVECIVGANELYDVCKFKVNGRTAPIAIAATPSAQGNSLWVVANKDGKTALDECKVEKTETFMEKYAYYLLAMDENPSNAGCPIVNKEGKLTGLLQLSKSSNAINAVDAAFVDGLATNGLSVNNTMYKSTGIKLNMPVDRQEALIMLVMSKEQCDSTRYVEYVDDFIERFPNEINGYSTRAMNNVSAGNFEKADSDMKLALEKATDKAGAHAEYSSIIYQKLIYSSDTTFTAWNLDKALEEIRKAYELSPEPAYKHREAQIIYTKGDYQTAYDMFMALTKEDMKSDELFLEAAQCKMQLNAPDAEVITLLDSAVAACPKPLTNISAPYLLARGQMHDKMGNYRKALADYNVYDTLMLGNAGHEFYYTKFKCEVNVKQFKQALNDIAHAAYINPREPIYLAEMASLQLRVGSLDDAVRSADLCIALAPDYPDAYLIKGLALLRKEDKAGGLESLEKAKSLGDERAQAFIDKYK